MHVKRILSLFLLFLLTLQFNLNSCSEKDTNPLTAPENTPSNNYEVIVEITSFGGVSGCTSGRVVSPSGLVSDALVTVNGEVLASDPELLGNGLYADTLNAISYLPGTSYELSINHQGQEVATGKARMPSVPEITNLTSPEDHNPNSDLTVKWKKVKNATSIEVYISATVYDSEAGEEYGKEFSSGFLSPLKQSFTIPASFFDVPGEYVLGITAYYGINEGQTPDTESEGYMKGYNVNGAAGVFYASNTYPDESGLQVLVGLESKSNSKKTAVGQRTLKEYLLDRNRRIFQR